MIVREASAPRRVKENGEGRGSLEPQPRRSVMNRSKIMRLLTLTVAVTVTAAFAGDALAKKKKKKKKKKKAPAEVTEPPEVDTIADQLGDYKWGMSVEEVIAAAIEEVKAEYQFKASTLNDSIKEDKLFQRRDKAIKKIKKSYVEFKGQPTGWDSSVAKEEYTHKNGESMIEVRHDKWTDYFFFISNPTYDPTAGSDASRWVRNEVILWKLYRAFDSAMFPGLKWANVQEIMTVKFGAGPFKVKKFDKDTKFVNVIGLQWRDDNSILTLVNQFTFFGIFCLRFESAKISKQIDILRVNKPPKQDKGHAIVDGLDDGTGSDSESDIVDVLTGKAHGKGSSVKQKKKYK
jgi:hypothetical protein